VRTIQSTVVWGAVVALMACGRAPHRARAGLDAAAVAAAGDAPVPDAAGPPLPAHRTFPTLAEAITAIVPDDARVVGFGELHARTDRPGVRPALAAFRDDLLPTLAPRLSDLVLETWIVDPSCGQKAKVATARVETALKRPAETKNELAETVTAAKAAGVQVHAMRLGCADYETIAPARGAGVEIETLLGLVTRELGRIALSAIAFRDKQADHRPWIAVYGGALHNDRFPYDSVAQWSYAASVDRASKDHFVEIDLFAPELAAADPLYAKEDWFPLVGAARPDRVLVFERGVRSFVVILASTPGTPNPPPR